MDASFWDGLRPAGVPDKIDFNQHKNIVDVFDVAVARHANKSAYTSIDKTMSYRDLDQYSRQFAAYLQNQKQLKPGDRIAIQLPNSLQYPIALFGAFRAGLVVVNTNPLYTASEMLHQFRDSGVKALVYIDLFGDRVEQVLKRYSIDVLIQTSLADMLAWPKRQLINAAIKYVKKMVPDFQVESSVAFRETLTKGKKLPYKQRLNSNPDDVAMLQYTGGTTGVAKGAMLTQKNLIANMLQVEAMYKQINTDGKPLHNPGFETAVAPLPLYHIYSFMVHMLCQINGGDHSILIGNPRDTKMMIRMIKNKKFTTMTGIDTLFVGLLSNPEFEKCDFSELKATFAGGAAMSEDTRKKWLQLTNCNVSEGYGLTECSPVVTINSPGEFTIPGTVGMPVPGTSLKVVDKNGNELPLGERGELCVKGPQVMKGYWQREEESDLILDKQGWLRTGDVAVIDERGYVSIVDRLKDTIIVSGFNVYPNEIEDVVNTHPLVELSAVIGVKNKKTGEAPKLFVVPNSESLTQEVLKSYCKEHLTGYKQPKIIEFRKELPMSPVGKILRKDLQ
jgi:long-chain acyl-CoA synthetase